MKLSTIAGFLALGMMVYYFRGMMWLGEEMATYDFQRGVVWSISLIIACIRESRDSIPPNPPVSP